MTTTTFVKVSGAVSVAKANNDTIVLTAPAGYTAATAITASGAKLWCAGLQRMFTQGASNFSVSYSTDITITYLGSTSIPAGTRFDFYVPQIGALNALTDSTGGTASNTLAAITAPAANAVTSLTADMTAVKNALASLAAKQALLQTAIANANLNNA
jgi:hypothetical protein